MNRLTIQQAHSLRTLYWLRTDLRLTDNPALEHACQTASKLLCVYIWDEAVYPVGAAQRWWLHHSLIALNQSLAKRGHSLLCLRGDALIHINALVDLHAIEQVCWNRCYHPAAIFQSKQLKLQLQSNKIFVKSFNRSLLIEPSQFFNKQGGFFKVFTSFYKAARASLSLPQCAVAPNHWPKAISHAGDDISAWQLYSIKPNWTKGFNCFVPGESQAQIQLDDFVTSSAACYGDYRDRHDLRGTSELSAALHFGELSPQQIWAACGDHSESLVRQLFWRDFAHYLLIHFPRLPEANFKPAFDQFRWQHNETWLQAWQRGVTGFPLVDAGMRQLWRTGWMHNRVRMVVASFLTKDCLIDWRHGMAWFEYTLLDADLANNAMGWQWVAGSGPDASPYFRIFNPTVQSEKFDPEGTYIRKWLPELAQMPSRYIHQPSHAPADVLHQASVIIGRDYPEPIVDHAQARHKALAAYQRVRLLK